MSYEVTAQEDTYLGLIPPCPQVRQPHTRIPPLTGEPQPRLPRTDLHPERRPLPAAHHRPRATHHLPHRAPCVAKPVPGCHLAADNVDQSRPNIDQRFKTCTSGFLLSAV